MRYNSQKNNVYFLVILNINYSKHAKIKVSFPGSHSFLLFLISLIPKAAFSGKFSFWRKVPGSEQVSKRSTRKNIYRFPYKERFGRAILFWNLCSFQSSTFFLWLTGEHRTHPCICYTQVNGRQLFMNKESHLSIAKLNNLKITYENDNLSIKKLILLQIDIH